jgi:hypothetical protein
MSDRNRVLFLVTILNRTDYISITIHSTARSNLVRSLIKNDAIKHTDSAALWRPQLHCVKAVNNVRLNMALRGLEINNESDEW